MFRSIAIEKIEILIKLIETTHCDNIIYKYYIKVNVVNFHYYQWCWRGALKPRSYMEKNDLNERESLIPTYQRIYDIAYNNRYQTIT